MPGRSFVGPGFRGRVELGRVEGVGVGAGCWVVEDNVAVSLDVRDEDPRLRDANEASRSETLEVEAQNFMYRSTMRL